jgi:hypothetical protein
MPEPVRRSHFVSHLRAVLAFALLALGLTWPLAMHLQEAMIGTGVGDNASFVWNFWWMRQVLTDGASPFWTPALFAPIGTSLVLHTTTLLPTLTATALLPRADPLTTYNVAVIATVFLNGFCAYAAAYSLTRQPAAALVAGLVFAASPFLAVRLQGHFNVLSAWGLPLVVLTTVRLCQRASVIRAVFVACALGVLAYTDYYLLVFGLVFAVVYVLLQRRRIDVTVTPPTPARRWAMRVLTALLLVLIVVTVAIGLSGGTELVIAGLHLSARSTFNLRGAIWLLALITLLVWKSPRLRFPRVHAEALPWRALATGAVVLVVLLLPLVVQAARLFAQHDYASQTYLWRSAPPGIDVGALVLGNPWSPLYGGWIRDLYARLGIHAVESVAWLGIVPVGCLLFAASRLRAQAEVRRWLVLIALFLVWALGPYLMVFGANSGFILPQTLLRFVPLLANARMPGRAFVMVVLGVAMIVACVLASLATNPRRRRMLIAFAALLILADYWSAPPPLVTLDRPRLYQALRSLPSGPVLDLPLGLRDGFGERGHLDHRALFYQTLHEHPLAGGFVARLSPRIQRAYDEDPILSALLSDGPVPAGRPRSGESLACAFRYVIVPKATTPATRDLLNRAFQLERLDGDDLRDLYRVAACK